MDDNGANKNGYVELPNVDLAKEITDGMVASRAYIANVTAFNFFLALSQRDWISEN